MLRGIRDIGEYIIKRDKKNKLDIYLENPSPNDTYNNILSICFNDDLRYQKVELEKYSKQKIKRYLYKKGSSNGTNYSPSAKLTEPEKTFNNKILNWFKLLDHKNKYLNKEETDFLSTIRNELKNNSNEIIKRIKEIRKELPKKEGIFVTIKIKKEKDFYLGDLSIFEKVFMENCRNKGMEISAEDKVCSICGCRKERVIGNPGIYKFYTTDKEGFITGGFKKKNSWKNFPVCLDCKLYMEEGKKFVESNLKFRFCNMNYFLIPKFIIGQNYASEEITEILNESSIKSFSLKGDAVKGISNEVEDILHYLAESKDTITLNFLFLKTQNSAERILLLIEDIFPSRLKLIIKSKNKIDETFSSNFTLARLRNLFFKSDPKKSHPDLDSYFLNIVDRIFKGRKIDSNFIIRFAMKKTRNDFMNNRNYKYAVNDGLMVLLFLSDLKLIELEEINMKDRKFDRFFSNYKPAFQQPLKRGLFLLGVLTEMLLRKQYQERGNKPFMKNLKSLKMLEKDFKGLLPKVQNKLEEYNSFDKGKRLIASEASAYLMVSGDEWKMSADELNFYFAAGMNLVSEIADIVYEDKKKQAPELQIDENQNEEAI